jgi:hypothetical protein
VAAHRTAGQASAEYVAILLVVGTVLAGAAAAAAAVPGVGSRVVGVVRTGICIVGGDLCRSGDAAAAGLPPCVTSARSEREDTTVDIGVVRLGEHGEWLLALQSDGGAVVTRLERDDVGGTAGVGVTFSPLQINASASAAALIGYQGGRAWRFPDAPAARAFLERAQRDGVVADAGPADTRWDAIAGSAGASAGVAVADLASAGVTASADGAIGLRRDGGRKTLALNLGATRPAFTFELPGYWSPPPGARSLVAEVTWEAGAARDLALRTGATKDGRLEELVARLDLRDPESRAIAERVLRLPGRGLAAAMRGLVRRIATHGVVERLGYAVSERRGGFSVSGRLGVALGLSHERVSAERRLTDAIAWVRGGPPQRRFDCLGV